MSLPGLVILDVDRGPGLEVGHALEAREVEQDPACYDATFEVFDSDPAAPFGRVRGQGNVIVESAVVGEVAERVDVGDTVAVIGEAVGVARETPAHDVFEGGGPVVGSRFGNRIVGEGYSDPTLDQSGCLTGLGRGNQVQCSALVVGAPAPPIR